MSSEMSHVCHTNNGSRHGSCKVYLQDRFRCLPSFFRRFRFGNNHNLAIGEDVLFVTNSLFLICAGILRRFCIKFV